MNPLSSLRTGSVVRGAGVAIACVVPGVTRRAEVVATTYAAAWPIDRPGLQFLTIVPDEDEQAWRRLVVPVATSGASWTVAMSLAILVTGLTWSRHAGDQIRSFRDAIGQAPPAPPKGLQSVAAGRQPLAWEAMLQSARRQAGGVTLQMTPPRNAQGVWRIASSEQTEPAKKINLVLDAYSGQTLYQAGWKDQTVFSMGTAVGIPFHRGEFGWWNQALLFLFGAGVLFSLVSGWAMFLLRRRQGGAVLPRLLPGALGALPLGGWIAGAILLVAMPLFALSGAVVLVLEVALAWRQRTARMVLAQG